MRKAKLGYWAVSALVVVLGVLAAVVFVSGVSLASGLVLLALAVALLPVGAYLGMRETLYAFRSFGLLEQVVQLRQEVAALRSAAGGRVQPVAGNPATTATSASTASSATSVSVAAPGAPAVSESVADLEQVVAELRQEVRMLRLLELERP